MKLSTGDICAFWQTRPGQCGEYCLDTALMHTDCSCLVPGQDIGDLRDWPGERRVLGNQGRAQTMFALFALFACPGYRYVEATVTIHQSTTG